MDRIELKDCAYFDIEVFPNWYCVMFKQGSVYSTLNSLDLDPKDDKLSTSRYDETKEMFKNILCNETTVGYNSLNYDIPILMRILLAGGRIPPDKIYNLSKWLIEGAGSKLNYYEVLSGMKGTIRGLTPYELTKNHIDIERYNADKYTPLKVLGARMNYPVLESLPFNPHKEVSEVEIESLLKYCKHDVDITYKLATIYEDKLRVREHFKGEYPDLKFLNKRESQIGSSIMLYELGEKSQSGDGNKESTEESFYITYEPPSKIKFKTKALNDIITALKHTQIKVVKKVNNDGEMSSTIIPPRILNPLRVTLKGKDYIIKLGGLHAVVRAGYYVNNVIDSDVTSYYPNLMINEKIVPNQISHKSEEFFNIIRNTLLLKDKAGKEGNVEAKQGYKIILNSIYGQLNNPYSILYDPQKTIQVTLTGQFYLLMLLESLTTAGYQVINANTDGILVHLTEGQSIEDYKKICKEWEDLTKLNLGHEVHPSVLIRDGNNYAKSFYPSSETGLKSFKGVGCFKMNNLSKHPIHPIVFQAVSDYFLNGISVEDTIIQGGKNDIKRFLILAGVGKGNYITDKNNEFNFGRYVRFVWSIHTKRAISLKEYNTGRNISRGHNVVVLNELDYGDGDDPQIDYGRYIYEALEIIKDIKGGGKKELMADNRIKSRHKKLSDTIIRDITELERLKDKTLQDVYVKMNVEYDKITERFDKRLELLTKKVEKLNK